MEVLFIDWVSMPKETHLDILKNIPIGEYVDSLPYNTSDYRTWKIPVPNPVALTKADPRIMIDTEYIEFSERRVFQREKEYPHQITSEMYAWERTH